MSTQEPATWQEYLGQMIVSTQERARLATVLHVRPITLQRWVQGVSRPRDENIRLLLKNIPKDDYPLFLHLLLADFPDLLKEDIPPERFVHAVPTEFYARALSNLAQTPPSIYRQSMQDLILQQAIQHLDPDQHGCLITLACCVPPRPGKKVRSLHEMGRIATSPWNRQVEEKPGFFGMESLAGYAIAHAHRCTVNSRDESTFYPVQWIEHERSTAAFPVLRHGRFAGSLLFSSTREFFFSPARLAVIEEYAHLAACIFEAEETFDLQEIELKIMPSYAQQHPYFAGYHFRVTRKMVEANEQGKPITLQQARQLVWQDLEEILLQVSHTPGWSVAHQHASEHTNI
jgi:hypothetical protein